MCEANGRPLIFGHFTSALLGIDPLKIGFNQQDKDSTNPNTMNALL
jgi:hypothetical protein